MGTASITLKCSASRTAIEKNSMSICLDSHSTSLLPSYAQSAAEQCNQDNASAQVRIASISATVRRPWHCFVYNAWNYDFPSGSENCTKLQEE